jgi:hypothetical protein
MFTSDYFLLGYIVFLLIGYVGLVWWWVWINSADASGAHWIIHRVFVSIWIYFTAVFGLFLILKFNMIF